MVHPGRRYLSALVVVGLLALVPSCSPHRLQAGEARLSVDRGSRAFASEAGHRLQAVHGEQVLHLGARVRLVSGTARVQLADRSSMELRSVTELRLDRRPVLVAGDVLGISGDGPLTLQAGDATAVVGGVGRLTRTLAVSVTSYRGRTELQSAGRALSIKAPRQATVAALGELPGAAQPIAYDDRDGWDRRYLADAIALGRELAAPVQTFTRSLRTGAGCSGPASTSSCSRSWPGSRRSARTCWPPRPRHRARRWSAPRSRSPAVTARSPTAGPACSPSGRRARSGAWSPMTRTSRRRMGSSRT